MVSSDEFILSSSVNHYCLLKHLGRIFVFSATRTVSFVIHSIIYNDMKYVALNILDQISP